jgi:flagellum-specific ATP synthase
MDSVTRFAMAMREVGLAVGEPPTTKGYTPSVFATLPKLLERAGSFTDAGSITGLYTVLVDGDDMNEPIADAVRSILDGHIVLSRALAARNHYPCIDILASTSRVMRDISTPDQVQHAGKVREVLATFKEAEDLVNIGAYSQGSNPRIDHAIAKIDAVNRFLRQGIDEAVDLPKTLEQLKTVAA